MKKILGAMFLLTTILAACHTATAYSATGTISGTIVSTSITLGNQELGKMPANQSLYYYWNGSGTNYVEDNSAAGDAMKFATIDFATDNGNVEVSVAANNSLPETAGILVDNDNTPNANTALDADQVQMVGDELMTANISYAGAGSDNKIGYNNDGDVYVFFNTGEATEGSLNMDLTLTAS